MDPTQTTLAELFTTHLPLATKLGVKFSRQYGLPVGDVIEQARSILGEVVAGWNAHLTESYDASKGTSPTTWLYRILYWKLLDFCDRRRPRERCFSTLSPTGEQPQMKAPKSWVGTLLSNVGEDARTIVNTILFAPAELAEEFATLPPHRLRKRVRAYFHDTAGWTTNRLDNAWEEVDECLA